MATLHSPKNPYRVEINYARPVKCIGSVQSYTATSVDALKQWAKQAVNTAKTSATIIISKNLKTYPEFEWVVVEKYDLGKNGEAQ